jgi:hypothetical protein
LIYLLFYFLNICFRISFVVLVNYCLFELFTPFITRDVNGTDNLLPKSAFASVFEDMICTLENPTYMDKDGDMGQADTRWIQ